MNSDGIDIEMPIAKEAKVVRSFDWLGNIFSLIELNNRTMQIPAKINKPEILSPTIMPIKIQWAPYNSFVLKSRRKNKLRNISIKGSGFGVVA